MLKNLFKGGKIKNCKCSVRNALYVTKFKLEAINMSNANNLFHSGNIMFQHHFRAQ